MKKGISVLATGSELLDGRVHEANSFYVCSRLSDHLRSAAKVLLCGDSIEEIQESLRFLSSNASFIIISGGIGPTTDDNTREACARFANVNLIQNQFELEKLREAYAKRGRAFDPSNERQSFFPERSTVIPNEIGTAPGFRIEVNSVIIFSLPGVPSEFKKMFDSIFPEIKAVSEALELKKECFRVIGLPEATVNSRISKVAIPEEVHVSYRAMFPEIQVIVKSEAKFDLTDISRLVMNAIGGEFVFSTNLNEGFEETLHRLLITSGETVAVGESCTGGMIGSILTATPGSSNYFLGSLATYTNEAKVAILGADLAESISSHGAVSHKTAKLMAAKVRERLNASIGLSVTGYAGPGGGEEDCPVGTFFVGYSTQNVVESYRFFYSYRRDAVRRYAAYMTLDTLRRKLLGLEVHPDAAVE